MTNDVFPAKVVSTIPNIHGEIDSVTINRGKEQGIKNGQTFVIYALGNEVFDPDTNESLGILEIPKGQGTVVHVQEKMATILSNKFDVEEEEYEPLHRHSALSIALGGSGRRTRKIKDRLPFSGVETNDLAKPI